MIKDEDLRKATDYSKGQKDAAYSVLGEITNILSEYSDNIHLGISKIKELDLQKEQIIYINHY